MADDVSAGWARALEARECEILPGRIERMKAEGVGRSGRITQGELKTKACTFLGVLRQAASGAELQAPRP